MGHCIVVTGSEAVAIELNPPDKHGLELSPYRNGYAAADGGLKAISIRAIKGRHHF